MHSGVLQDEIIAVTVNDGATKSKLKLRKIGFYERELKREFEFLTNLFEMRPDLVAAIYKLHWQIELLYKQLKQNFPLKYFLGDNKNSNLLCLDNQFANDSHSKKAQKELGVFKSC